MEPLTFFWLLFAVLLFGATMYTQFGEELIVDFIDATASPGTHYIGAGTGAGSYVKGTVAIFTEVGEARVSATKTQPAADKNQWQATQNYTGTKTITNAAVCSGSTGSNVMLGVDALSIAVNNGDSIQYTFTLEQT